MPYKPAQARAIAADYTRRGKPIPEHVKREIAKALRGRPTSGKRKKKVSAKEAYARKRAESKHTKRPRRRR